MSYLFQTFSAHSSPGMQFPATEVNDTNSASVILQNKGSKLQLFEFGVPAGCFVQVTPRVGCLKANSSLRLQLDFAPPLALMQQEAGATAVAAAGSQQAGNSGAADGAAAGAALAPSTAVGGGAQPAQQQQPNQPGIHDANAKAQDTSSSSHWFWFREWLLPCYTRPAGPQDDLAALGFGQDAGAITDSSRANNAEANSTTNTHSEASPSIYPSGSPGGSDGVNVLHLAVTTCAVAPELHLVSPALPKPPGKNYFVLDFGALPVGERVTRQLELANKGTSGEALCEM
eukprot:GHUV01034592.1.p1 GENE.GHUV01034592.1~~GHUV01034592.1.p1  ORF type:complete len:294 (+),score=121.29 GHUV01034592.1:22-882(+)